VEQQEKKKRLPVRGKNFLKPVIGMNAEVGILS
jgi:hypothetical protein